MTERRINHLTRAFIEEMSQRARRHAGLPNCSICNGPVDLRTAKTDEDGKSVHEDCYVRRMRRREITLQPQSLVRHGTNRS
jgi:hypothetical protein